MTDGLVFSVVRLDEDVPYLLLDGHLLAKVARDAKQLVLKLDEGGGAKLSSPATTYTLPGNEHEGYPNFPDIPENFVLVEAWDQAAKVFFAAGDKASPDFAFVHFTESFVEATNKACFVRVECEFPFSGVVPVSAFQGFSPEMVQVAFTPEFAFFSDGSEIRIAPRLHGMYPDTAKLIPEKHVGLSALIPVPEFQNIVKQGKIIADLGLIYLFVNSECVRVEAWGADRVRKVYLGRVPLYHLKGWFGEQEVLVDGKILDMALARVETPNVKFCLAEDKLLPIRLEAGAYCACVWQMA